MDAATLTKVLNMAATAKIAWPPAVATEKEGTVPFSYSGAMEVGDGEDGCTKLVPGTGVSSLDGPGDITCALPSEVFEVETLAVCKSADHTSPR